MKSSPWLYLAKITLLAAAYIISTRIGLLLAIEEGNVSPVWPPSGLALAAVLLFGNRMWPGIALGAFLASLSTGAPLVFALGSTLGNCLEALLAAYLLRQFGFDNALKRVRDVLGLFFLAALLSPLISALIGVASLCWSGMAPWSAFTSIWWIWWLGNAAGVLVVAPFLLTWATFPHLNGSPRRLLEAIIWLLTLCLIILAIFGGIGRFNDDQYLFTYLFFPLLIWAAFRFGQRGVTTTNLIILGGAIWGTTQGYVPPIGHALEQNFLSMWVFMSVMVITTMLLAAIVAERQQTEAGLRESEARYRAIVEDQTEFITRWTPDGVRTFANEAYCHYFGQPREKLIGSSFFPLVAEKDQQMIWDKIKRLTPENPAETDEHRVIKPDGSEGWQQWTDRAIFDEAGRLVELQSVGRDITERKQAEAALQQEQQRLEQEQQRLRTVLDILPFALWVVDATGQSVAKSTASKDVWAEEVLPPTAPLIHKGWWPDSGQPLRSEDWSLRRTLATGEVVINEEILIEAFDGTKKSILNSSLPIHDSQGQVTGAVVLNMDITSLKRTEQALRESEAAARHFQEQLKTLHQVSIELARAPSFDELTRLAVELGRNRLGFDRLGLWFIDPDDPHFRLGSFGTDEQGQTRDERSLRFPIEAALQEVMDDAVVNEVFLEKVPLKYRERAPVYNDKWEIVGYGWITVVALWDGSQIIGFLCVDNFLKQQPILPYQVELLTLYSSTIAHLCTRKRSEAALRASEERFRLLAENAQDIVYRYRMAPTMGYDYISAAAKSITGYGPEEFYADAKLGGKIVHPEDRAALEATFQTSAYRDHSTVVLRWIRKDGQTVWLEQRGRYIFDESRQLIAVEGMVRDVTEQKSLEEQLRQAQKMEAIGRLAGGIAHDFNNLLTVIIGNCELVLAELEETHPLYRDIAQIKTAGERAASLTGRLLAFSRQQTLQPVELSLNKVIANMEPMLRRLIGEDIDLKATLEPELGFIKADPGQIEQVIMNLVINARDAMPEGGQLTLKTQNIYLDKVYTHQRAGVKSGPYVLLSITDTGSGMDETVQARIFEPFFTTKEPGKGTGLGLAVVHGLVTQSEGHISVYSQPGLGSTFSIYLPCLQSSGASLSQTDNLPRAQPGAETILLVEDEEIVREIARRILSKHNYTVLEAHRAPEAIELCRRHSGPIHLLLTDVVMPGGMSGPQLAQQLSQFYPEMKTLYISGYTDNAVVHHGVLEPELAFLQKPFTPDTLMRKVREVLDQV